MGPFRIGSIVVVSLFEELQLLDRLGTGLDENNVFLAVIHIHVI